MPYLDVALSLSKYTNTWFCVLLIVGRRSYAPSSQLPGFYKMVIKTSCEFDRLGDSYSSLNDQILTEALLFRRSPGLGAPAYRTDTRYAALGWHMTLTAQALDANHSSEHGSFYQYPRPCCPCAARV